VSRLVTVPDPVNVVWFDTVDSTNAVAERFVEGWLASEEYRLPETVVVARQQSMGRGRSGRSWESPAGGLYATWFAGLPARDLPVVPMAVGVSLAAAVEGLALNVRVGLKWPNDLQVDGAKLGGVLCSSRSAGEAAWVAAGFGVNVSTVPALAPGEGTQAVSLREVGFTGEVDEAIWTLVGGFLTHIHSAIADPRGTRSQWLARSVHAVGDRVRVRLPAGVVEGTLVGFGRFGEIELEVGGRRRRVSAAELMVTERQGGT